MATKKDPSTVTSLEVEDKRRLSLKGYVNLETLTGDFNCIKKLDLTPCPLLEKVSWTSCSTGEIKFPQNSKIRELDCSFNDLESFDATNLPNLEKLDICVNRELSGVLDLSMTKVRQVECSDCQLEKVILPSDWQLEPNEISNDELRCDDGVEVIMGGENYIYSKSWDTPSRLLPPDEWKPVVKPNDEPFSWDDYDDDPKSEENGEPADGFIQV